MKLVTTILVAPSSGVRLHSGHNSRKPVWIRFAALLACVLVTASCAGLGPKLIYAQRGDYNSALRDTEDRQLLGNLVRLRYRDTPFFLEVASVTTQYSFAPQAYATVAAGSPSIEQDLLVGGNVSFIERPTVAYVPLQGEAFARRFLTPLSLETLLLLSRSGWDLDRLLRLCAQRLNGIPNAVSASGLMPMRAPQFREFQAIAGLARQLQLDDEMTVGFREGEGYTLRFSDDALVNPSYAELVERLGLTAGRREFSLTTSFGADNGQIVIQTQSLNGMLHYLSHAVEIPAEHHDFGLVGQTIDESGAEFNWTDLTDGLMRIRTSPVPPTNAAVSVYLRGHWFYISDDDLDSKSTFSLLAQIFALQAGSVEGTVPLMTIPLGQ